jgi:hypothetical protein
VTIVEQVLENRRSLSKVPGYKSFSPEVIRGIQEVLKQLPNCPTPPVFGELSEPGPFLKRQADAVAFPRISARAAQSYSEGASAHPSGGRITDSVDMY